MIVLALDCSGDACSAALLADGETRARRVERLGRGHAERIAPMLSEVLEEAGFSATELDLVAATVGPGAFTGVRIALAAAQGLARAAGVPAVGVTVTEAIAADIAVPSDARPLLVAIDSRRADPFGEWFDAVGGVWRGRGAEVLDAKALSSDDAPVLAGSAAPSIQANLPDARVAPDREWADPVAVARVAAEAWARDSSRPPVPLYLRAPDVSAPNRDKNRRGATP